jgi:hypothetical protein
MREFFATPGLRYVRAVEEILLRADAKGLSCVARQREAGWRRRSPSNAIEIAALFSLFSSLPLNLPLAHSPRRAGHDDRTNRGRGRAAAVGAPRAAGLGLFQESKVVERVMPDLLT